MASSSAPSSLVTAEDHSLAAALAEGAGQLLLALRHQLEAGIDPATVRKAGDLSSHEWLMAELATRRPTDAVLSEEAAADPARLDATRTWIVDPLDGTREFGESGRTDWAVHVALVVAGDPLAGAVALPAAGLTLSTALPPALPVRTDRAPVVVVSRTRPPAAAEAVAEALQATLLPMGSAGAKAMAVVRGEADIYVHSGGQYEWDSAAPVAVARAAGLHTSRADGTPLRYNQENPWLPDLLICRHEFADQVLAVLARQTDPD